MRAAQGRATVAVTGTRGADLARTTCCEHQEQDLHAQGPKQASCPGSHAESRQRDRSRSPTLTALNNRSGWPTALLDMLATQAEKLTSELERIVLARIESDRLIVPAMPAVALRCLHTLRDPEFQIKKLVSQLESDPVLAALVLRYANTAAMGAAMRHLNQAVARLGAQRVKTIVMEHASHELFQSPDKRIAEANRKIWEHSLAVALLSRDLATATGSPDADLAYLGGLLHDVGKPVLASMMLEAERKLGTGRSGWIDSERWINGVAMAHRRVGTAVATQWNLPAEVTEAIRERTDYDNTDRGCPANIVRLANAIAKREGYVTGPSTPDVFAEQIAAGCAVIGIDDAALTSVTANLRVRVEQATG